MTQITVNIKGTFDIAIARHTMRTELLMTRIITPKMSVRAAIALTALGELIIALQTGKSVPVTLQHSQRDDDHYFDYSCSVPSVEIENKAYKRYQTNLQHISHVFALSQDETNLEITGSILLGENRNTTVRKMGNSW